MLQDRKHIGSDSGSSLDSVGIGDQPSPGSQLQDRRTRANRLDACRLTANESH